MNKTLFTLFLTLFLLLGVGENLLANGIVSGKIVDADTGEPLIGANIVIDGTMLGTTSIRGGEFRIIAVPAGSYQLTASYLGFGDVGESVNVADNQATNITINMKGQFLTGDEVVVRSGHRVGQALVLNQQKMAINVKNIVAADQIGSFPDPNVAEALQRIPAIGVQRDQGEGRYVVIRGAEPNLNTVQINDQRIPAPEGDIRNVALDVIPADQLASIEVNKTLTPDMDGDAIGGAINLITKSGLDYDRPDIKVNLEGGMATISEDMSYRIGGNYATRLGENKNIGLQVSASHKVDARGSDNIEMSYDTFDLDDTPATEEIDAVDELELRDYTVTRTRSSISTNLDYLWNDNSRNYINFIWNQFGDQEYRRRMRVRFGKGDFETGNNVKSAEIERELKDRYEVQRIYSLGVGGMHTIVDQMMDVDYKIAYSYAEEEEPDHLDWNYVMEDVDLKYDFSDPDAPGFTVTNGVDLNNTDNYLLDEVSYSDNLTTESELSTQLNLKRHMKLMGSPAFLKAGLKLRQKSKDRENNVYTYSPEQDFTLTELVGDFRANDFMDGDYDNVEVAMHPDPDKAETWFNAHKDDSNYFDKEEEYEDTDASNYDATENITAFYLMGEAKVMPKLSVLTGFRMEMTNIDYNGHKINYDTDGDYASTQNVSATNDFANIMPALHLKYSLNKSANLRFAFTQSIARPNYYDLVPYEIRNNEEGEEEIVRGNSNLEPATANNIDLLGEYYFQSIGILSGGFYYKTIDNYMYTQKSEEIHSGINYDVEQPINAGETGSLMGLEVAYNHELSFLPGWMGGLSVYANYSYTDSKIDFELESGDTRESQLPGQAQTMYNLALGYERYGFSTKLSVNHTGEHILSVGGDESEDEWLSNHTQVDLNASYNIWKGMDIYADFINLTNEPYVVYMGDENHPIQREYYQWWMHFGLKYAF